MLNHPRILCVFCVAVLWAVAWMAHSLRCRLRVKDIEIRDNMALVLGATLTLLGLIIGFTFNMATTRYDLRRGYEEGEANAIGTEYLRAQLMPAGAERTRALLRDYTDARLGFYDAGYGAGVAHANVRTAALQNLLWQSIAPAAGTPNPVTALVVAGMNDVINAQGYTQAAWWNRIPATAWWLMLIVAIFANAMVGYSATSNRHTGLLLWVLPLIVSVSFFLIADIDSPRGGLIRIPPVDLIALQKSY